MVNKYLICIISALAISISCFAQNVKYDKTDANGRIIITEPKFLYTEANDNCNIALWYYNNQQDEQYFISLESEEELSVFAGYKLLLSHKDGTRTELTCIHVNDHMDVSGNLSIIFCDYYRHCRSDCCIIYGVTKEQLMKIEDSPVIRIRIEQVLGYSDRRTPGIQGSTLSSAVAYGHKRILNSLATRHTGLYDHF